MKVDLTTRLAGLQLKNPVLTASGTFGFGEEYARFYDLALLGGITVKGITLEPRIGNPVPRIAETPSGILNAVGLENPGLEAFLSTYLPRLEKLKTAVIVNISGFSLEEYAKLAAALPENSCIAALEVNISCPNIKDGGMAFGTDPQSAGEVLAVTRKQTKLPLIAKLSPNVTDIVAIAKAVEENGADIISLINTLLGMRIDLDRGRPLLANTMGGLSGPAVRPVAVRMVYQVYQAVRLPIIGMGGISCWQDAVEFMLAGASAVSVGTANFINPLAPLEIINGLEAYCRQKGYHSVKELVGLAHRKEEPFDEEKR
ncbi:MAG: dihydroorotate dehydrogenase [Firmicutes bacterium]|nr:dihydroorotate dehydrogenase [Bacillota bacterium]